MSLQRIDRRTNMMRKQVKRRSTVNKYKIEGPIHWEGEDDDDESLGEDSSENADSGRTSWFVTQTPEWLPQLYPGDNDSGSDGTPSPDAEGDVMV